MTTLLYGFIAAWIITWALWRVASWLIATTPGAVHRTLVNEVRAEDARILASYRPTPMYRAGVYRCRTHSAGNDPADMLVLYGARCRRTLALAQLDPLDFDEFSEDLCWTRGGPQDVADIVDGLLRVAERAARWDDSDHIARALMGRDARRTLAALAHITGDNDAASTSSTP